MSLEVDILKCYGQFTLDVSFRAGNEILALLGASGCGKSLTLKCIAGIERPDEGRIVLDGRVLFDSKAKVDLPPQKRRAGYLFQQYALFPHMTVEQNVAAGVRDKSRRADVVSEKLAAMRLESMRKKLPAQISGGEQQRVALARILASEPEILMLDEPLSALDDYLKWQVELELADAMAAFGGTAIYVSHSRDEVYRLCDTVCVLNKGKSEPRQAVGELFSAPATLTACRLSGCKNFSRAERVDDHHVYAQDWGTALAVARRVPEDCAYVGIRAHYVCRVEGPGENAVPCVVGRVIEDMFSTVVMLNTPGGAKGFSQLRIETDKRDWDKLAGNRSFWAFLPPEALMPLKK
jgi:molybdate transport system ATP-binding protein